VVFLVVGSIWIDYLRKMVRVFQVFNELKLIAISRKLKITDDEMSIVAEDERKKVGDDQWRSIAKELADISKGAI
jgi:hypothetical protein